MVLDGRRRESVWELDELRFVQSAVPGLAGALPPPGGEEVYEALSPLREDLGLIAPIEEFASAWRWGAVGAYSTLVALHPGAALDHLVRTEHDAGAALTDERRLQRFAEVALRPLVRRGLSPAALGKLLATVGTWCPMNPRVLVEPHSSLEDFERVSGELERLLPLWWDHARGEPPSE